MLSDALREKEALRNHAFTQFLIPPEEILNARPQMNAQIGKYHKSLPRRGLRVKFTLLLRWMGQSVGATQIFALLRVQSSRGIDGQEGNTRAWGTASRVRLR